MHEFEEEIVRIALVQAKDFRKQQTQNIGTEGL